MLTGVNVTGYLSSVEQLAANKVPDIDKVLYRLQPMQYPVLQVLYFLNGKKAAPVTNEDGKFSHFEDEFYPMSTTITNITGGATSEDNITLVDNTFFQENDICIIWKTQEMVYVDSIESSQVDITKMGDGNITACTEGSIRVIGTRVAEKSTPRTAVNTKEIEVYNYLNMFSESVETTRRHNAGKRYTMGKSQADLTEQRMLEMKLKMENWFLLSNAYGTANVTGAGKVTHGKGLLGHITTNVESFSGNMTEAGLTDFFKSIAVHGSTDKIGYVGTEWLIQFNNAIRDRENTRYQISKDTEVGGLRIMEYKTPFGVNISLIHDPVLQDEWSKYGFFVDENSTRLRYMAADPESGISGKPHIQRMPIVGTYTEDWLTADMGIEVFNEEKCGIYYGV